jgi:hypothetical protein
MSLGEWREFEARLSLPIRNYLTYLPLIGFVATLVIALVLGVGDWKVTAVQQQ